MVNDSPSLPGKVVMLNNSPSLPGKVVMVVADEAKVHVNGEYVSGKLEIMHGDRYNTMFTGRVASGDSCL